MAEQNILTGDLAVLDQIIGDLKEHRKNIEQLEKLNEIAKDLTKNIENDERELKEEIDGRIKESTASICEGYDKAIDSEKSKLKDIQSQRDKAKMAGVKERIANETKELRNQNEEFEKQIKDAFKMEKVPMYCSRRFYRIMIQTRGFADSAVYTLILLVLFLGIPALISFVPGIQMWMLIVYYFAVSMIIILPTKIVTDKTVGRHGAIINAARETKDKIIANRKKIKKIEKRIHSDKNLATGGKCNSIVIENDGEYKEVEYVPKTLAELSRDEIRERIKAAGVVGMGGAGFPTNVKLTPKNPDEIDYIIVNGAECEPYLTSDYRRLIEESDKVVMGLKVALALFDHAKGIIGIEDNKPDAIKIMQEKTANEPNIEVKVLKTKYPQGGERCLIYATTGRSINSSMLPADAGCIVHNVDTIYSIYMAVIEGKPLTKRIVTVTGDGVKNPGNFYVWLGMNYRQLVDAAGGLNGEPEKFISGGPMMGFAMYSLDVPVVKGSSSLLVMQKDIVSHISSSACIRCGRCGEGCPSHLLPAKLAGFASRNDETGFTKFDGMECVECGSCSYVCPAKRPLTQQIKAMRRTIMANRRKK